MSAALAAVLCAVGTGCSCADTTTVLPVGKQQYDALSARYGPEALPDYECEALCMRTVTVVPNGVGCGSGGNGGSAGSGASAGSGGSGGAGGTPPWCSPHELEQFVSITECKLTTVEWVEPAVICTGSLPCYG